MTMKSGARLTDTIVRSLMLPEKGNVVIWDKGQGAVAGFGCRITSGGARAFVLNYRVAGRERRYTIGATADWSAGAAREEAKRLKKLISQGQDPMGVRHADRAAPTMAELFVEFDEAHITGKRPATQADYRGMFQKYVKPVLGSRKAAEITHSDVVRLHRKISTDAPYRANRVKALLSKMFSWAIREKYVETNPAKGLELNPEQNRQRFLSQEELAHLTIALAGLQDQRSANAIRLLLLTGARRTEALSASWDQFDLEAGHWVKPSSHTKQKREHSVPLSAAAIELLTKIRADQMAKAERDDIDPPEYVFPGDAASPHLIDVKKSWHTAREAATVSLWAARSERPESALTLRMKTGDELPTYDAVVARAQAERIQLPVAMIDVRLHDLRHSFASTLASAGLTLPMIGALLGHSQVSTTGRYAHLSDDPLRQAVNRVGEAFTAASTGKTAEIVSLPIRR